MKKSVLISSLFIIVIMFSFIKADVVSINSGGSNEVVILSNENIWGFFFGQDSVDSGEEEGESEGGDTGGDSEDTSSSGGGGGGGGGGGSTVSTSTSQIDLSVNPSELSISAIQGINEQREITLTNTGDSTLIVTTEVSGEEIENVLSIVSSSITLTPGQSKNLEINLIVEGNKFLTGKILLKYSTFIVEVPVIVGSKSENFLFDISVFLSNEDKKIRPGENINPQFNLLEVQANEKVDVVANYVVKDFEGNNYYEETETFFVEGEKSFTKEIPTNSLERGKYVLGFEISYPQAFAVSSVTFDVEEPQTQTILIFSLIVIGVIASAIIFVKYARRKIKSHVSKRHEKRRKFWLK